MKFVGLITVAVLMCNCLAGNDLNLCVRNPAKLDPMTLESFQKELQTIAGRSGRPASFEACGPGIVTITLRLDPPEEEPTALGATRQKNGRLIPQIELYVSPTAGMIETRLPGVLGRALARVATHELVHWLSQDPEHATHGVMLERLTAAHLMARDRSFFRIPAGRPPSGR